jgi:hypothetical protein
MSLLRRYLPILTWGAEYSRRTFINGTEKADDVPADLLRPAAIMPVAAMRTVRESKRVVWRSRE